MHVRTLRRTRVALAIAALFGSASAQAQGFTPPPSPGDDGADTVDGGDAGDTVDGGDAAAPTANTAPSLVDPSPVTAGLEPGGSVIVPLPEPGSRGGDAEGDALGWAFADAPGEARLDVEGGDATLSGARLSFFAEAGFEGELAIPLVLMEVDTGEMLTSSETLAVNIAVAANAPAPEPTPAAPAPEPVPELAPGPAPEPDAAPEAPEPGPAPPPEPDAGPAPELAPEPGAAPAPGDEDGSGDGTDDPGPFAPPPSPGDAGDPAEPGTDAPEGDAPEPAEPEPAPSADGDEADADAGGDATVPMPSTEPEPDADADADGAMDDGAADDGAADDGAGDGAAPEGSAEGEPTTVPTTAEDADGVPVRGLRLVAASESAIAIAWDSGPRTAATVERDGVVVASVEGGRYVDTDVVAGQRYVYTLGTNPGAGEIRVVAETDGPGADLRSPVAPGEVLALRRDDGSVVVAWQGGGDDRGIEGYDLYRDGRYFTTVYATAYVDAAAPDAVGTLYEIAAFDEARNYSPRSVATFVDGPVPPKDNDVGPVAVTSDARGRFAFAPVNRSASVIVLVGDDAATALWPSAAPGGAEAAGFATADDSLEVLVLPAFGVGEPSVLGLQLQGGAGASSTLVFDPSSAADDGR